MINGNLSTHSSQLTPPPLEDKAQPLQNACCNLNEVRREIFLEMLGARSPNESYAKISDQVLQKLAQQVAERAVVLRQDAAKDLNSAAWSRDLVHSVVQPSVICLVETRKSAAGAESIREVMRYHHPECLSYGGIDGMYIMKLSRDGIFALAALDNVIRISADDPRP